MVDVNYMDSCEHCWPCSDIHGPLIHPVLFGHKWPFNHACMTSTTISSIFPSMFHIVHTVILCVNAANRVNLDINEPLILYFTATCCRL
jgi:hypothetical protein